MPITDVQTAQVCRLTTGPAVGEAYCRGPVRPPAHSRPGAPRDSTGPGERKNRTGLIKSPMSYDSHAMEPPGGALVQERYARGPDIVAFRSTAAHWAQLAALAALYVLAGKLGLHFAFVHASVTAVWPPTGIALAAFLLFGPRVWPAVALGAFLVNVTTAGSVATSLGVAAGNTLEGLLSAWLVNRFAHGRYAF